MDGHNRGLNHLIFFIFLNISISGTRAESSSFADFNYAPYEARGESETHRHEVVERRNKTLTVKSPVPPLFMVSKAPRPEDMSRSLPEKLTGNSACSGGFAQNNWLKDVVKEAFIYSSEIKSAEAEVIASEFDIDRERGKRWPQMRVGVSAPIDHVGSGEWNRYQASPSDTSAALNVATTLYDFGKIASGIQVAEGGATAAKASVGTIRNQQAYNTLQAILELQQYQQGMKIAVQWQRRMRQLVAMMRAIIVQDQGRKSELTQAQMKLLQANTEVHRLESTIRNTQIKLVRLIGHEVILPACLSWEGNMIGENSAFKGMENHPILLQAKAELGISISTEAAAKAARYPTLNWVISKNTAKNTLGKENDWSTGVELVWELFTGGSASATQKAAAQRVSASKMKYETSIRGLVYQLNGLLYERDSSLKRAREYEKLAEESDQVRQIFYEQWHSLGKRSLLDVLTAENDHYNHQMSAITTRYNSYMANIGIMATSSLLLTWLDGSAVSWTNQDSDRS